MRLTEVIAGLSSIGGLAGIAALLTAARQLRPNHGSSMRDAVDRIETAVTALDHRLGHEMGEIRRTMDREHSDYDARLRRLEHDRHDHHHRDDHHP